MASSVNLNLPGYYTDPYYSQSQDYLFPFGKNLLEGNPNSYYAPIGNWGGAELQDIINMGSRDISNAVNSDLAGKNMSRSGLAAESIGSKVGDMSSTLRWNDFLRAMTGRQNLLNTGLNTMTGVRSAAQTNMSGVNSYNLGAAGLDLNAQNMDIQNQNSEDQMWASILGAGVGLAGNIYGMNTMKDIFGSVAPAMGKIGSGSGNDIDIMELIKGSGLSFR